MSDSLKRYQSIKQVHAQPMTFGDFVNNVRPLQVGKKMDPNAEGYHVIYAKGTPDEFHSWSPKKAFEEGYLELPENAVTTGQSSGKVS